MPIAIQTKAGHGIENINGRIPLRENMEAARMKADAIPAINIFREIL